ncbi:MAG: hypothetical protein ACK5PG_16720 [Lysobacterales bacterium]
MEATDADMDKAKHVRRFLFRPAQRGALMKPAIEEMSKENHFRIVLRRRVSACSDQHEKARPSGALRFA